MKTLLAPGFKARMLGLEGWYSTNILGNGTEKYLMLRRTLNPNRFLN